MAAVNAVAEVAEIVPSNPVRALRPGMATTRLARVATEATSYASKAKRSVSLLPCRLQRVVCVSRARFGEVADHITDSIAAGQPRWLATDFAGAAQRRRNAMRGVPLRAGFDRDEYPFAFARPGRSMRPASVRYVDPSLNRAAGAFIRNQLPDIDGYRFMVRVVD
jgi:hypothetical protein